jgi:hypothetical protein
VKKDGIGVSSRPVLSGALFESRPGHRLSWLNSSAIFNSISRYSTSIEPDCSFFNWVLTYQSIFLGFEAACNSRNAESIIKRTKQLRLIWAVRPVSLGWPWTAVLKANAMRIVNIIRIFAVRLVFSTKCVYGQTSIDASRRLPALCYINLSSVSVDPRIDSDTSRHCNTISDD